MYLLVPAVPGWAQTPIPPGGTSLPPRGYVLPPPLGFNPQAARSQPAPDAKPSKSAAVPTASKKKNSAPEPPKRPAAVAKSTPKMDAKPIANASTKHASAKPSVATTTKRKMPTPEPITKQLAATKPKPAEPKVTTKPDLGEPPQDSKAEPTEAVAKTRQKIEGIVPPNFDSTAAPTEITSSAMKLPNAVVHSEAMMPLPMPNQPPARQARTAPVIVSSHTDAAMPREPKAAAAADLALTQMKSTAAALAAPPRAQIVQEIDIPIQDLPPAPELEHRIASHNGGGTPAAQPAIISLHETPSSSLLPTEPGITLDSPLISANPAQIETVQPTLASMQPAAYRTAPPSPPPAVKPTPREATTEFTSEAKFSAADTPPPTATKPAVKLSPSLGALSIDADRADTEDDKNRVSFNGNVNLTCERFTLKADKLIANLAEKDDASGVKKVLSEGHVVVNMNGAEAGSPGFIASGSSAIYDPEKETMLLKGWPKIEEGNKSLIASSAATEILIDTKTGRLTTTGSTKTVLK